MKRNSFKLRCGRWCVAVWLTGLSSYPIAILTVLLIVQVLAARRSPNQPPVEVISPLAQLLLVVR